jgi:hypothetical protein
MVFCTLTVPGFGASAQRKGYVCLCCRNVILSPCGKRLLHASEREQNNESDVWNGKTITQQDLHTLGHFYIIAWI